LLRITLQELPEHLSAVRAAIESGAAADEDTESPD